MTGLKKTYHVSGRRVPVLRGLNLQPAQPGITVILGRSGCGKTTLLRLVAGLEEADSGTIDWEGREKGRTGVIFQEPRLMPWLSVEKNILFGVRRDRKNQEKLRYLLELTGLAGFEKARPSQLSGGMQQRAALARALAYEPDYLLMDEPFAAMDYFTRAQMQQELVRIYEKEKKGILFVTHSIDEALTVGTRIVILEDGVCRREYGLEHMAFPRDLMSCEMITLKRQLIAAIGQTEYGAGGQERVQAAGYSHTGTTSLCPELQGDFV